ncbi:MAG: ATP-dependent helicase, RecQ family [Planctomycetota bacterium]|nr:ATP-dependent helicase, RecQ family [Planctomycetota bacterium]
MSIAGTSPIDLERTLRERFALERFRPGQREVIEQVLAGKDVLCVMPTGGGKSLCYQLPALRLNGVTLVVSPLIALMKDQVDALSARGIRATLINSTLDLAEQNARLAEIELGEYDLVYVAPERFRSGRFVEMMNRVRPALLAVDEAHCISEWGHDFRPDYARLGAARRALGMPPCIALTATATDLVRRDIADQLDLHEPQQFVTGFDRPNLTYHARNARKDVDKFNALTAVLERNPGPAIVYASSRKRCEEIRAFVAKSIRRDAVIYHAGLTREERTIAQDRFMGGDADVVVATNAFGMGVDKADIRSVTHFNMPGTLEAYYQEAGRAGRDGLPAECVLLYAPGDRFLQEMFIENEYPPKDAVYRIYDYLRTLDADPIELTQAEIREAVPVELNESAVGTAVRILESASALERFRPRENMAIVRMNCEPDEPPFSQRVGASAHVQKIVALGIEGLVNRRFGETIYFQPDEFASRLGLDRTALTRAIKNLASEFTLDYIPPFRGNALRVLDRNKRSKDIVIDFSSLMTRKKQEYDKLERMLRYAESKSCRRAYILGYFGDHDISQCGRCDNCGGAERPRPALSVPPIDTSAGREVIQKILSGVARAKSRFGKIAVAQMLVGSTSERMERSGLTRLSTFGILAKSGFTQKEVAEILDALLNGGLIESEEVDRFKPVIKLSEAGWAWIRDIESPPLQLPLTHDLVERIRLGGLERIASNPNRAKSPPILPSGSGEELHDSTFAADDISGDPLHESLRRLRLKLARESDLSPAYVFSNETLSELVRQRPRTPQSLVQVKGIGPSKLERFGAAILDLIKSSGGPSVEEPVTERVETPDRREPQELPPGRKSLNLESTPRRPEPSSRPEEATSPPSMSSAGSYVPTEEWTWRLLDRGFSMDEAAAIRGLELAAVVRHALWMVRKGKTVALNSFLSSEEQASWSEWLQTHGAVSPPPDQASAKLYWTLFVACHAPMNPTTESLPSDWN